MDRATVIAVAIGDEYPAVDLIYLVGSRLRGEAREDSDYDVIIVARLEQDERLAALPYEWLTPDDAEDRFDWLKGHDLKGHDPERKERLDAAIPHEHSSGRWGSNPRPSAWEADALPTELRPRGRSV